MLSWQLGQRHRQMIHTFSIVLLLVGITAEPLILIGVDSYRRQRLLVLATTRSKSAVPSPKP
jgi:hypothetical protein